MLVSVPASSANLGSGFDTLAVALPKRLTVEVEEADKFELVSLNQGSDKVLTQQELENHVVAEVLKRVCGHVNFRVTIDSAIPLARGLGSSAALILAVAKSAGSDDPLKVAVELEGHADNAVASFVGGLVAAEYSKGKINYVSIDIDARLEFVLFVPDFELSTKKAREVLPNSYSRQLISNSLGRLALTVAGLSDLNKLLPVAFEDLVHQPYREHLYPDSKVVINQMVQCGAVGAVWSGAGPSIVGFCNGNADLVAKSLINCLEGLKFEYTVEAVKPETEGLRLLQD